MKKYRQLLLGVIIGALLFGVIPAIANVTTYIAELADFPVVVNGESITFDKPIVTIEGSTYLPLRAIGDVLGVKVDWNEVLQQAEIEKNGNILMPRSTIDGYVLSASSIYNEELVQEEDGVYYITLKYIEKEAQQYKYIYNYDVKTEEIVISHYDYNNGGKEVAKRHKPQKWINDKACISFEYFVKEIAPVAKSTLPVTNKYTPPEDVVNDYNYIWKDNGVYYATAFMIQKECEKNGYNLDYDYDNDEFFILKDGKEITRYKYIPFLYGEIPYDFYVDEILPLLK